MTRAQVLSPQAGPSDPNVVAGFEIKVADDSVQMVLPADIEGVDRVVVDLPLTGLGLVDEVSNLRVDRSGAQPLDPAVASRRFCRLDVCEFRADDGELGEQRTAATVWLAS